MNTSTTEHEIRRAVELIQAGHVIAYPTESVYGLGCDPLNQNAVANLLQIKQRPIGKGLILVASEFDQVLPFVELPSPQNLTPVFASWPGPVTWIFPAKPETPRWLTGDHHHSIAIRISAHPTIQALCSQYGKPIISTSANISGMMPARTAGMLKMTFTDKIKMIVPGKVGALSKPTTIRDVITGEVLRA